MKKRKGLADLTREDMLKRIDELLDLGSKKMKDFEVVKDKINGFPVVDVKERALKMKLEVLEHGNRLYIAKLQKLTKSTAPLPA